MQSPLAILYPPHCVLCGTPIEDGHGLCGSCWAETPFVVGLVCEKCGAPLPGDDDGHDDLCDDCLTTVRPWEAGRAALLYKDTARKMVLDLKFHDRLEIVPAAAGWMARALRPIARPHMLIVPIPAHWTRIFTRKYNQAAELARALGRETGYEVAPNALIRPRRTDPQEGKGHDGRFANLEGAIKPHPRQRTRLTGRDILLVDDVMTSGATLAAATEACHAAGARDVFTLVLARAAKDA